MEALIDPGGAVWLGAVWLDAVWLWKGKGVAEEEEEDTTAFAD